MVRIFSLATLLSLTHGCTVDGSGAPVQLPDEGQTTVGRDSSTGSGEPSTVADAATPGDAGGSDTSTGNTGGGAASPGNAGADAASPGNAGAGADAASSADAGADAEIPVVDASVDPSDAGDAVGPSEADASVEPANLLCQADPELPQRTDYAQPGPYEVGKLDTTFEDASRSIPATDQHPAASSRKLVTTIYYPTSGDSAGFGDPPLAEGGPFPMLMYSHGYSSGRTEAVATAERAASYGYIVVVPDFPLTSLLANNASPDVSDAANQPGDVSFLIDQMLALSQDASHTLGGGVDETRIGALGVSLGGLTTLLVTFHPQMQDPRIKVSMPIAALSSFFLEGFYKTRDVPILLLHGDLDSFVEYDLNARRAFERAVPNARLITVADGSHAAFGNQFDPALLPLLSAVLAPSDADPSNPDGVGCGAVAGTLSESDRPGFLDALGGPENFVDPTVPHLAPCDGDQYTHPAMDPLEQADIMVRAATAFFEAHLSDDPDARQDGCRYLLHELPKEPAVTLE